MGKSPLSDMWFENISSHSFSSLSLQSKSFKFWSSPVYQKFSLSHAFGVVAMKS